MELASRLSPQPADRARRLRLAAGSLLDYGTAAPAGPLLDRADAAAAEDPTTVDVIERVRRLQLRSRLPPSAGGASEPVTTLRAVAREVTSASPALAVDLLLDALAAYSACRCARRHGERGRGGDRPARPRRRCSPARRLDVLTGALRLSRGDAGGERLLDRYLEMTRPRSAADEVFLAEVLAPVLGFLRRTDAVLVLLAELEADLRTRGAVRRLISVLAAQSMNQYGRSFAATVTTGTEAIALAESNGSPELASVAAASLAMCSAVIGDRALRDRAAELLADVAEVERRAVGPIGHGYLAFAQAWYDDADAHFSRVRQMLPIGCGLIRWEPEWMEALIRIGRRHDATSVLDELAAVVSPTVLKSHGGERVSTGCSPSTTTSPRRLRRGRGGGRSGGEPAVRRPR